MEENEVEILQDLLNSITRPVLYRFSRDVLELDVEPNTKKENLIDVIISDVSEYQDQFDELIKFINTTQEWGRQHIFLFRSSPDTRRTFRNMSTEDVTRTLTQNELNLEVNQIRPLFIPEDEGFELFKVFHTEGRRISISWAEKRTIHSRAEGNDYFNTEQQIEYRAWRPHIVRGVTCLDWDLGNGQMMIKVSQSSKKSNYEIGKQMALDFMSDIFAINDWTALDIRKSIAQIKDSGEVSTKKYNQETTSGGKQSLQARDKNHGIESDSELNQASRAIRRQYASTYGNFFWLPDDDENILKEVHTTIDSKTKSFLLYGIHPEETVRYIIGRIIHHIR